MLCRSSRLRTTLSKLVPQLLFLHQASPTQLETDLTRNYATPTGTPETSTDVGAKTWPTVATTNTPGPCSTWFCQRHLAAPSPPTPCLFTQPRGSQPFLFRWQVKLSNLSKFGSSFCFLFSFSWHLSSPSLVVSLFFRRLSVLAVSLLDHPFMVPFLPSVGFVLGQTCLCVCE